MRYLILCSYCDYGTMVFFRPLPRRLSLVNPPNGVLKSQGPNIDPQLIETTKSCCRKAIVSSYQINYAPIWGSRVLLETPAPSNTYKGTAGVGLCSSRARVRNTPQAYKNQHSQSIASAARRLEPVCHQYTRVPNQKPTASPTHKHRRGLDDYQHYGPIFTI